MNNRVYALLLLMMTFPIFYALGDERTDLQMKQAAMDMLNTHSMGTYMIPRQISQLKQMKRLSKVAIYGYEDGGFAVISTDDRFQAVIGFSDSNYSDTIMPCGFKWWLETVNSVMEKRDRQEQIYNRIRMTLPSVSPFLTTKWGQGNPFNAFLQYSIGGTSYEFVTGCVATAMAQVIKYYKFPEKAEGSVSYVVWNYRAKMNHTFDDFYDWDNMLDEYNYQEWGNMSTPTKAVATLMRDCGMAVKTNYGPQSMGSGANSQEITPAMKEYFSYADGTTYYKRSDYSNEIWMQMIYDELSNNRPIIYTGIDKSDPENPSGHAFVLHGYNSDGQVYVNWGWKGYYDGYYDIDLLNPDTNQFSEEQDMVFVTPGKTCLLTVKVSGNGSVNYGNATVRNNTSSFNPVKGKNTTFAITPDLGYVIKSIKINGVDMISNMSSNQYIIENLQTDTFVEILFSEDDSTPQSEYNQYITCSCTSFSKSSIGSSVNVSLSFEITNFGNSNIYVNKIIGQDPETHDAIFTLTESDANGLLKGNSTKTHTIKLTQNISQTPILEMKYTWNDNEYVYFSSRNRILKIEANDYGFITFAGISIGNTPKKFSVEPGGQASIIITPKENCIFRKLMVNKKDVTSDISNNKYTIMNINSFISVKAVFDSNSEDHPTVDGYEYVDLGLNSGKCWSTINYGAHNPEDAGIYNSDYNDIVNSNWGENWRKPTKEEFQELLDECLWTWTEHNGTNGFEIKGPNGKSIFLPAAGYEKYYFSPEYYGVGTTAYYLTSSKNSFYTWILKATSSSQVMISDYISSEEYPIRPISNIVKEPILYKLTYMVDGELYKTIELKAGVTIVPEPAPTKEGHTFSGWSEIPEVMPAHDVTVSGTFTANKYLLTYVVDGQKYKSYDVDFGATITPEPAPTKEGHTFSGWSEIPATMPAHDVTVTGSFSKGCYMLTYIVDGELYKTVDYDFGVVITPEPAPEREGYTFSGWSDIPATMPAHDVTVTGTFTVNKYQLTYIVDGEEYKTYEVEYGATITPEQEPVKEGFIFSGWNGLPETMPAHVVIVVGTFTKAKYMLTYVVNGEVYKSQKLEYGAAITPEPTPTKEGHTFSGWSEIPATMPAHDVTVTGTFSVNKYILTYILDGKEYKTTELEYGTAISPESDPEKEGYTFSGWSEIPKTMPAHIVIITGSFTINSYTLTYMIDEVVYKQVVYEYGATITPEPQPESDYKTFEWVGVPETMPAHDVTVRAVYETGITEIMMMAQQGQVRIYSPNGKKLSKPQKGLNIVVMQDGTVKKVVVK